MGLSAGTRLGPYEIESALGAGGMGEVYRARDTRLDRTVAIKVLKAAISSPDLKARFEREARAISSLQHRNICTLYDVGNQEGMEFLVMEYLEGQTLAARLVHGRIPSDQLLKIAIDVADALATAHRSRIVHRDLKPANVMLTKAGPKLLDFGLAKPLAAEAASAQPASNGYSRTPATPAAASVFGATLSMTSPASPLTSAGSVVGTVQYMSPEQIHGVEADARSDIFSFGIILFEMATGKHAFQGKTQSAVVGSILAVDPPNVSSIQPDVPPGFDRIVSTCLEKDPEQRFQHAHDLKLQLLAVADMGLKPRLERERPRFGPLPWLAAAALIFMMTAVAGYFARLAFAPRPVTRSHILPPPGARFVTFRGAGSAPAISPDGTRLVFLARDEKGRDMLFVRSIESLTSLPLAGTENAIGPFWSPDSLTIGFFADNKLKRIQWNGGPAQVLCDAYDARGGSWSRNGVIVFGSTTSPIQQVSAAGGKASPATKFDTTRLESSHRWPFFLPDGKHFLFWTRSGLGADKTGIAVGSLDSLNHSFVLASEFAATYAPPGYLLFVRDTTLMAQPFSTRRLALTSDAVPIAEQVASNAGVWRSVFSNSENGTLLYQSGRGVSGWKLTWFDRSGKALSELGTNDRFRWPSMSPDGTRAAIATGTGSYGGNYDIWVYDLRRQTRTRITFEPSNEDQPTWSPDGKTIYYVSDRKGQNHIYARAADGSGAEETTLESSDGPDQYPAVSPDGKYLAFDSMRPGMSAHLGIWAMPLVGDRKPFPVVQSDFDAFFPAVSPDGKWVAYSSNENGRFEVYITPFPHGGAKWQVSTTGGYGARWRGDGKQLYFVVPGAGLAAADFATSGTSPLLGTPHLFLQAEPVPGPLGPFAVSQDGKKFLVNNISMETNQDPLTLVTNWTEALKK